MDTARNRDNNSLTEVMLSTDSLKHKAQIGKVMRKWKEQDDSKMLWKACEDTPRISHRDRRVFNDFVPAWWPRLEIPTQHRKTQ